MVIQHNMAAMFSQRQLGITTGIMAKSSEKLSSGYRINRAADDAAGLAISEKMRRQIRGLTQNMENIQDGVSFVQVADGYLNEVHDMLQRINELSVKGANGTLTSSDRGYIDREVQEIKDEIENIFKTASFNEMKIFRIPYSPTVEPNPEPYDMQVYYSEPGKVGGLEFNNVRYSLEELADKGMSLDENGKATKDQTVEFKLNVPQDETVSLSLKKGDGLQDVVRKYEWKADDTGIKINNVLAATWSQLGITEHGTNPSSCSFDFRGTKISFDIEEGNTLSDVIDGINGDSITEPSYWEISQSSTTGRSSVALPNGVSSVRVTESNKNVADDKYEIVASDAGLAIKRTDKTNPGSDNNTSPASAWGGFTNVGPAIPRTPAEDTHGYPIADWGIGSDSNDSSDITFDTEAVYHYSGTIDNMTINYDFRLADVASKDEIISGFNGSNLGGSVDPNTSRLNSSDTSKLSFGSSNITARNESAFQMQRAYGRNFDSNAALNGSFSWTKTKNADSEHIMTSSNTVETGSHSSTASSETYRYKDDLGRYHEVTGEKITTVVESWQRTERYEWDENYTLNISGSLGTTNMADKSADVAVHYTEDKRFDYTMTSTYISPENAGTDTIITDQDVIDSWDPSTIHSGKHTGSSPVKSAESDGGSTKTFADNAYPSSSTYKDTANNLNAFNYTYRISHSDIVNTAGGSTSYTLSFNGNATRNFSPNLNSRDVAEYDFNKIVVVPPKKEMIIQATPNSPLEEQIPITWSGLNLSVIGMSGASTLTQSAALGTIDLTKSAIDKISLERTNFGAAQNKLEHAYNYTANARENTQHSESIIRDTEMNSEIMRLRNTEILAQAGQAMLAQANQSSQGVLSLLQ